jgi:hypothetical protein
VNEPLADEWVTRPNTNEIFGKQRPVDFMMEGGLPAMLTTRRYIEAVRGGL